MRQLFARALSTAGYEVFVAMLARYTHPTEEWKIGALDLPWLRTQRAHDDEAAEPPND